MSEVMTQGIIGMPFDLAMSNELSRLQFHGRAQSLLSDYAALEAECRRLQRLVKMLVRQHMPLEPVDGLDGWSEVISARKAIELRDAALTECERLRHALTKIHDRCEAFVGDDSGMQVHSVEVLMEIAARGLGANK